MPIDWSVIRAVLFDLDGVLTPTATVHRAAWKRAFDRYLAREGVETPFSDDDYLEFVDGRPRYDGVRSFLGSRSLSLPEGDPTDPAGFETIQALGNLKNDMVQTVLTEEGVTPYREIVELVDRLAEMGIAQAVVSSSANARGVLEAAGLTSRFPVVVDAIVARTESLPGKPAPDTFLHAASLLGVEPGAAMVVEDAIAGVKAGRAGAFGVVVGVARHGDATDLAAAGAHVVVETLDELLPPD